MVEFIHVVQSEGAFVDHTCENDPISKRTHKSRVRFNYCQDIIQCWTLFYFAGRIANPPWGASLRSQIHQAGWQ